MQLNGLRPIRMIDLVGISLVERNITDFFFLSTKSI